MRQYEFNEHYFENIETEVQAYLLGYIMADGYVGQHKYLTLQLQSSDIEILELLKKEIGADYSIKEVKGRNQHRLSLCSVIMVSSLVQYGIKQNKTFDIDVPKLPPNLIPHFMRGYFDGDGWIGEKQFTLVSASPKFCESFSKLAETISGVPIPKKEKEGRKSVDLQMNRKHTSFLKYMYDFDDSYPVLKRKKERFLKYWKQ